MLSSSVANQIATEYFTFDANPTSVVKPGVRVAIVGKGDDGEYPEVEEVAQHHAKQTVGIVKQILTHNYIHPNVIEVELISGAVGRVARVITPEEHAAEEAHGSQEALSPELKPWACSACTYLNPLYNTECEACQTKKPLALAAWTNIQSN
ncbi:uncharacterized protein BJ171DRAFT_517437 [Polychytrium aggregatum]|uniref:uncharacterized protein n=1 Tax=Polychytrium aggregatum TaxID=110093 RepID=UPI0022FEE0F2|nr:uncharacterized protein BJ171DRAFT_517437 [Polychytrium aggregatum]KAI9199666.1 hypothetical protein BJ171DRAFT_517437 [Polychytrium aggregatum]